MTYIVNHEAILEALKTKGLLCKCGFSAPFVRDGKMRDQCEVIREFAEHCEAAHGEKIPPEFEAFLKLPPERLFVEMLNLFQIKPEHIEDAIRRGLLVKVRGG